jgi:hypothetical protein
VSLDDLLPLLLVAFFIVNAFLRGGRRQRSRGQGAPPARPPRGRGQASSGGPQAGDAAPSTSTNVEDVLAKRLEEARRRVRASTEGGAKGAGTESSTAASPASSPPRSSTSASAPAAAPSAPARSTPSAPLPAFLGREGTAPKRDGQPPASGFLGREGPPPSTRRPSGREARTRTTEERSARLPAAVGIAIDPDDVVRGVIWSEVLGPPLAARPRRRTVSRRRSH